jgi:hypothetical protein
MRRWIASTFIAGYLGTLCFGLFAHSMNFARLSHPAMYFIVWDMYCGWSAYETRVHLIAEGESGAYYALNPTPWRAFVPFGAYERVNYDHNGSFIPELARNALAHTRHERIVRVMMVEEAWSKKFNLSDSLWDLRYDVPKEPYSYYHVLATHNSSGECLQRSLGWIAYQNELGVLDNPRLRADVRKGHTVFAANPHAMRDANVTPAGFEWPVGPANDGE